MPPKGIPRSAQYGQACQRCTTAKCRCIRRADGNGCERCYRLSQQCRPQTRTHAPGPSNGIISDSRIAQLEDRLDTLLSLLQERGVDPDAHPTATVTETETDTYTTVTIPGVGALPITPDDYDDSPLRASTDGEAITHGLHVSVPEHDHNSAHVPPERDTTVNVEIDDPSAASLDLFRSRMLLHFPVVHLSPSSTGEQLRHDRPLLFQAILCVAWPFAREKEARAVEVKRALCEAAFLRQTHAPIDQSAGLHAPIVDLLLAIMIYVAWGWDHVHSRSNLSRLVMLSMSLVGEILTHLDMSNSNLLHHTGSLLPPVTSRASLAAPRLSAEAQRAVLGCFVLSSVVADYFGNMDSLPWTPQLEKTLVDLSANNGCQADAELVYQVRLQLLSTKAAQLRHGLQAQVNQQYETISTMSPANVFSDAETLHKELQDFRRHHSCSSRHHQLEMAHSQYVELNIFETIRASSLILSRLNAQENANVGSSNSSNVNGSGGDPAEEPPPPGYSDLSYMWQSVLSISACTSGLLSLPPSDFLGIAFVQWAQLAGCVVVLAQLESLEDARINRAHARSVIDLPVLLNRIAEKLSLTATQAGEQGLGPPGGVFTQLERGMRDFRSRIQGSIVELQRPGPGEVSGCGGSNAAQPLEGHLNTQGTASRFWMDQLFQG